MRHFSRLILGAIIGGILGTTLALVLAPTSGVVLRKRLLGAFGKLREEVVSASQQRRQELEKQLADLRAPQPPK